MEWRIQLYIKLSNLNETFILFYLPEMVWIQYFNYAKKEDLLMSNSCLNTQCFFFVDVRKKVLFFTLVGFLFYFLFLRFFFEKEKNTAKKEIDGGLKDVIIYCQSWKMTNHFFFRVKTGLQLSSFSISPFLS